MIIAGDYACNVNKVRIQIRKAKILMNLEGPVLPERHQLNSVLKAGPSLFSTYLPSQDREYIVSLANNHIMDFGDEGLLRTLEALRQNGCCSVGAGQELLEARRSIIIEDSNVKIGVIACCEAQFGMSGAKKSGVAEIGPWIYSEIMRLKKQVKHIIISIHGGIEDSPWPSPRRQELYRSYIDAGATVVHGHHSHIPQGFEEYGNGVIFYGLGNFVVDPDIWSNTSNALWSLGAEFKFYTDIFVWKLLIFKTSKENSTIFVKEISQKDSDIYQEYLENCNSPLKDISLLEGLWHETSLRTFYGYKAQYLNITIKKKTFSIRVQYIKSFLIKTLYRLIFKNKHERMARQKYLLWYVLFACYSHQSSLATAFGLLGGELEDRRTNLTQELADRMMPWSRGVANL